jgi:hypothetical protein
VIAGCLLNAAGGKMLFELQLGDVAFRCALKKGDE